MHADAVQKHRKFFGGDDDGGEADSSGMGTAAAMQALKMFSGGSSSGSTSQGAFMALAMSEASKVCWPSLALMCSSCRCITLWCWLPALIPPTQYLLPLHSSIRSSMARSNCIAKPG